MSVIYSLVCRGTQVLAECTNEGLSGNFTTVTRTLLKKIPSDRDGRLSYVYDQYCFHYVVFDGLTYLCMTDRDFARESAFHFLQEVQHRFLATYGDRGKTAIAFSLNTDFQHTLKSQMQKVNSARGRSDRLVQVQDQVDQVKNVMIQNIDKVLERGEKIELLVNKTELLGEHAIKFNIRSRRLKNKLWWKNVKLWILIAIILAIVLYTILAFSCGGLALPNC